MEPLKNAIFHGETPNDIVSLLIPWIAGGVTTNAFTNFLFAFGILLRFKSLKTAKPS